MHQALPVKSAAAATADRGWSIRTRPVPAPAAAEAPTSATSASLAAADNNCCAIVIDWAADCDLELTAEEVSRGVKEVGQRGWVGGAWGAGGRCHQCDGASPPLPSGVAACTAPAPSPRMSSQHPTPPGSPPLCYRSSALSTPLRPSTPPPFCPRGNRLRACCCAASPRACAPPAAALYGRPAAAVATCAPPWQPPRAAPIQPHTHEPGPPPPLPPPCMKGPALHCGFAPPHPPLSTPALFWASFLAPPRLCNVFFTQQQALSAQQSGGAVLPEQPLGERWLCISRGE